MSAGPAQTLDDLEARHYDGLASHGPERRQAEARLKRALDEQFMATHAVVQARDTFRAAVNGYEAACREALAASMALVTLVDRACLHGEAGAQVPELPRAIALREAPAKAEA